MLIYAPHITSRLLYIAKWLGELTEIKITCTDDQKLFEQEKGICINYSSSRIKQREFWIQPSGLLFENNIKEQDIQVEYKDGLPVLFRNESDCDFDFFSAAFFLLSRYEEYLTREKDIYGRYPHTQSIAYKHGFLDRPVADEWSQLFLKKLKAKFPEFAYTNPFFKFQPTYDIDIAYSYKGKGFFRNLAGGLLHPTEIFNRIRVLLSHLKDPYDAYSYMETLHNTMSAYPICFMLTAIRRSKLDRNISHRSKEFMDLVRSLRTYSIIGLHPSVYAATHPAYLIQEKNVLESITEKPVRISRFHYLKFNLPEDYFRLIEAGITDDYSMGYGTINGFRASTSRSFLWYNLACEETSTLRLHPFAWMDANSYYEQGLNTQETINELKFYREKVMSVNGTLITIAHNHFLGTNTLLKDWNPHYRAFVNETASL